MSVAANTTAVQRIRGSSSTGLYYPSPFFDVASTYLPRTIKELFQWCEYYYLTHPILHQVINKMAEYPITDIIIEDEDVEVCRWWSELFHDRLRYKAFLVEVGLDYFTYGNTYVTLFFPFVKYLTCTKCKNRFNGEAILDRWSFNNFIFNLNCPKCGYKGEAKVEDEYPVNIERIKLGRLNPHNVIIEGSEFGDYFYFYQVPETITREWLIGKKYSVVSTPQMMIEARKNNKMVIWNRDNLYHLRRATISGTTVPYGVPLLMPVLKDTFLLQLFKKTTEITLLERAVPLRVLFPQAATASGGPIELTQLSKWKSQIEETLRRWRLDPGYIGILSWPLGQQLIGGDARTFLLGPELTAHIDLLLAGLGVPKEFLIGGLSYSGTNISLRMLENHFINFRSHLEHLTKFIINRIAAYSKKKKPKGVSFKPFRMVDDLQRKMYLFQLNQAKKVSDTTLLDYNEMDIDKEIMLMKEENKKQEELLEQMLLTQAEWQAKSQALAQKIGLKTQAELQKYQEKLQQEEGNMPLAPQNLLSQINMIATKALELPQDKRKEYIEKLTNTYPEVGNMVQEMIKKMEVAGMGRSAMEPLPEQKPPRRIE